MKFLFKANANKMDDFQWIAQRSDCKAHNSKFYIPHPLWHRWKGGYRVRGHLSPMTCYQKQSYQKRTASFKRMRTYKVYRRNSNFVLYNEHYRFRGYY